MTSQQLWKLHLLVLACCLLAPADDAQRGRKRAPRGGRGGSAALLLPSPRAGSPRGAAGLGALAVPSGRAALSGNLLPEPDSGAGGPVLPTLPAFDAEGKPFPWTDPTDPELESHYFDICDHDTSEWVSYREARISLSLTRQSYALFDTDRDGRIDRAEFAARYAAVVEHAGAFPPPKSPVAAAGGNAGSSEAAPDPELVRAVDTFSPFDSDGDGRLSEAELAPVIDVFELGGTKVTASRLMGAVDDDASGAVDLQELTVLMSALQIAQKKFLGTIVDPIGLASESPSSGTQPTRPSDRGPVPRFERLDLDGDGFVTVEDLSALQAPMHLSVRTSAVVASLDRDGDGRLSRAEFVGALE